MKLKSLLLAAGVALGSLFGTADKAVAQVSSYTFAQSTGTYTPLTGATVLASATAVTGAVPSLDSYVDSVSALPFTFSFNGVGYTKCYMSSNGFISFGSAKPTTTSSPLSTTMAGTDGVIAPWARDLNAVYNTVSNGVTYNGDMSWGVTGTAPNRKVVFQWKNFRPAYGSSATLVYGFDFQVMLEEGTNNIQFVYGGLLSYLAGSTTISGTVQVGLRGATTADFNNRTNATTVAFNASTAGTTSTSSQAFNTAVNPPGMPSSGLTYTWTPPSCFAPTAVTVTSITSSGATLNWTAPTTVPTGGYQYEIRSSGAAGSGTTGLIASGTTTSAITTVSATGLAANTAYDVYVRSNCGAGTYSNWTTVTSFTTACAAFIAPFIEGFNAAALPACWTNSNTISSTSSTLQWKFGSGADYGTTNNGRASGTYAWVDASSPYNATVILTSPIINLSSLTIPFVRFDWFKNNSTSSTNTVPPSYASNNLMLEGYNGSAWVTLFNDTSNSTLWRTERITLPASFTGVTNAQFRFSVDKTLSNYFYDDVLLDSFVVTNMPTCIAPGTPTISNIQATGATISWTASSSAPANGYAYEVRTSGAAGSGATGLAATGTTAAGVTTANVTGLSGSTTYSVYVRAVCATGNSGWTAVTTFKTLCAPVSVLPWTDDLESIATIGTTNFPNCWKKINGDWRSADAAFASYHDPRSGNRYLIDYYSATNEWMMTPGFQLTAGQSYDFSFYWAGDGYAGWTGEVGVNTIQDSTGATILGSPFVEATTTTVRGVYNEETRTFVPATSGVYYFGIRVNAASAPSYLGFDDFRMEKTPTCQKPTQLTALNITSSSAMLDWLPSVSNPGIGYQYEVRTSGAPGSGATGRVAFGTTASNVSSAAITGLSPVTNYSYYVRAICTAGDTSAWNNAVFATECGVYTIPYTENFNSTTSTLFPPQCWTQARGVLTQNSTLTRNTGVWLSDDYMNVVANGKAARINLYYYNTRRDWLISPSIDLGTNPTAYELTFKLGMTTASSTTLGTALGSDDTLAVVISYDNGVTWNKFDTLRRWTSANGQIPSQIVTLPITSSGIVKVAFYASEGDVDDVPSNDIFIDSVTVKPCTAPIVRLGNDTAICAGTTAIISTGTQNPGTTFLWSSGELTPSINVTTAGTYSVQVASANGCIGRDTIVVTSQPSPVVRLGNDTSICTGTTLTLNPNTSGTGSTYLWSNGATTATNTVNASGTYSVRVTNAAGCIGRDTISVNVIPMPTAGTINYTGSNGVYVFSSNGATNASGHIWTFGDFSPIVSTPTASHTYAANGTYNVIYRVANACGTDTVAMTITVSGVGLKDVNGIDDKVELFPNPATAFVTIRNSGKLTAMARVDVVSATGAVVRSVKPAKGSTEISIPVADLAAGSYLVRIEMDNQKTVLRKMQITR